ncbi:hypothetical protein [Acinetobacter brisouii]|uniref:hypothetical protein n=1 Tax=Acinetobacter brisouii TaxID=396323 RepID=UPI00208EB3BE|nr:hypothetical protein [Acinetobacter brisouii]
MNAPYKPEIFHTPFDHTKYVLVRNQQQLDQILRLLEVDDSFEFLDMGYPAQVTTYQKDGRNLCIVQIGHDQVEKLKVASLLAHESVHVWQKTRIAMGETAPSSEFEAYSIQRIFQDLLYALNESEDTTESKIQENQTIRSKIKQTFSQLFKK